MKSTRLSFDMDPNTRVALALILERTGATNKSDAIRRAVHTLGNILEAQKKGGRLLLEAADGTQTPAFVL